MIDENYLALLSGAYRNLPRNGKKSKTHIMSDVPNIIFNTARYEKISFNCNFVLWP